VGLPSPLRINELEATAGWKTGQLVPGSWARDSLSQETELRFGAAVIREAREVIDRLKSLIGLEKLW
jgi:hypothetical protein